MEEERCCDLEVDVNGEETFMVNKRVISAFSSRLGKLFGKSTPKAARNLKLIFNDFPGGAKSFELITRFCYNNGKAKITPLNVCSLNAAARYMEMDKSVVGIRSLVQQSEKFVEEISCWTWSELMAALKQCQDILQFDSLLPVVEKCIESLVERLILAGPCASTSSPDSSGFRFSCDSKSPESFKNSVTRVTWWFEDLAFMEPSLVQMVIKSMVAHKLNHYMVGRFLFFYQKTKFSSASSEERRKLIETVIDMLFLLDWNIFPCKSLFGLLRMCFNLNVDKLSRTKLESMIGAQMDKATLDNLLVPAPSGTNCLYDVNLVLRFLKAFLLRGYSLPSSSQIKRVVSLMDVYITEVAPDPSLKASKFIALVTALPDSARECHDAIYQAIDIYLQIHASLSEEENLRLCSSVKYEKLSPQAYNHLTQNIRFALKTVTQVPRSPNIHLERFAPQRIIKSDPAVESLCSETDKTKGEMQEANEQEAGVYDGEQDVREDNERLKAHILGMQCRVIELEQACKKMQNQMSKFMKSRSTNRSNLRMDNERLDELFRPLVASSILFSMLVDTVNYAAEVHDIVHKAFSKN